MQSRNREEREACRWSAGLRNLTLSSSHFLSRWALTDRLSPLRHSAPVAPYRQAARPVFRCIHPPFALFLIKPLPPRLSGQRNATERFFPNLMGCFQLLWSGLTLCTGRISSLATAFLPYSIRARSHHPDAAGSTGRVPFAILLLLTFRNCRRAFRGSLRGDSCHSTSSFSLRRALVLPRCRPMRTGSASPVRKYPSSLSGADVLRDKPPPATHPPSSFTESAFQRSSCHNVVAFRDDQSFVDSGLTER